MRRPLIFPLLALFAGILAGDSFAIHYQHLAVIALILLVPLLICIRKHWTYAAFGFTLGLVFIAGLFSIARYQYVFSHDDHIRRYAGQGKLTFEGVVLSDEHTFPDRSLLVVDAIRLYSNKTYKRVSGKIRLVTPADLSFSAGDFIRFHSVVKPVSTFHNPGGFDYQRYLNRQGIFVSGFISGPQDIVLIRHQWKKSVPAFIDHFRQYLKKLIYHYVPSPEREILEAMTTGNQKAIAPEIQDAFARTGTSHILSISGLHVGLVASAGFFLALFLLKFSEYLMLRFNIIKIAAAVCLIPVLVYTLIAGLGTPVLRSAFMALSILIALILGRPRDLYNVLFGAAFIILVVLPESLFEISFQLSFSAVFALIYIVPKFDRPDLAFLSAMPPWLQTVVRQAYLFILVSMAATIGTLPLIIYYFNRISTVTIIANLIAVPLLGMLVLLLILLFILAAVFSPALAGWIIQGASFFTSFSLKLIERLAALPWASISVVKPTIPEMLLLYLILFGVIELAARPSAGKEKLTGFRHPVLIKALLAVSLALLTIDAIYLYLKDKTSTHLTLTAIDVGQGSSTLIELPDGKTMLVDGGGFPGSVFDMGKSVIAPFLYYKRIRKVDIVVLTHPHPDHLQGLIHIIDNFDVGEVWTTDANADDDLYILWDNTLSKRKIQIRRISAANPSESHYGIKFDYLWPESARRSATHCDANDQSLVFKLTYGTRSFLLTGDISSAVESQLLHSGKNLRSDLMFVPHHGSIHSSTPEFIDAVSPQFAIISAGINNVFHHPHPGTLKRYDQHHVNLFRTDRQGAITIRTDGYNIVIYPFIK